MASKLSATLIIFMTFNILFFTLAMASCPEDTSKLFGCVPAFKGELVYLILREPCCSLVKSCLCNQTVITDLILKVGSFDRLQGACLRYASLLPKCN
ncbi:BnaC02g43630D [Brassica napus]|uniref:BnaC02g43630D protein n=1 Tax=Brassica napus TaxID=3708 RepID=A0A078H900_BRANA|nr:BnaC02g43630D [Brassica napus]